ncbi:MAG TPA: putative sulfate exporter family transporter, partial [Spongiibacteraceae bacterium]|nr:putative sulfate exporter family transporter [Spongiibacteraceae bacterium]
MTIVALQAGRNDRAALIPGIALSAGIAALSLALEHIGVLQRNGIGVLTLAIVLGMLVGNSFYPMIAQQAAHGVTFSKQQLLRWGIVLYGLRLTFQDIAQVGVTGMAIDIVIVCSTFTVAWFVGTRVLGLDRRTAMLIGAGSSICGAAAVMATEPVVRGRAEQVAVAVATVVVFGTLSMFLYLVLHTLNATWHFLPQGATVFGLYTGATVHEVAQVVAAARAISADTANTAVIVKMVRVMLLAPFL